MKISFKVNIDKDLKVISYAYISNELESLLHLCRDSLSPESLRLRVFSISMTFQYNSHRCLSCCRCWRSLLKSSMRLFYLTWFILKLLHLLLWLCKMWFIFMRWNPPMKMHITVDIFDDEKSFQFVGLKKKMLKSLRHKFSWALSSIFQKYKWNR